MKRPLICILALFVVVTSTLSQVTPYHLNPNKKLYQYLIDHWSMENNLPTNSVLHIYQSTQGYIWISSYGGIIRFDGEEFTNFNKSNSKNLTTNNIGRIAEDSYGNIWFTSQEGGLIKYSENSIESFGIDDGISDLYRAIYIDKNDKIWLASPDKGWLFFENGEFNILPNSTELKKIEVRAILESKKGIIYFGTLGHGLFQYKNGNFNQLTTKNGLPSDWIYSIYFDDNNNLFLGTSNGLFLNKNGTYSKVDLKVPTTVNTINEDKFGNIWLATTTGLFRISKDAKNIEHLTSEFGLYHDFINDLYFDFEGNLWLANYKGGVSRIKDGKFTNYTPKSGLDGKVVNAICELSPQKYLIAFDNGNLNIIDNGEIKPFNKVSNLTGKRVRHILKDSKGNLWFSTYSGLLKLKPDNQQIWFKASNGFPDTKIRVAFEDSKGNIWIGTRNAGAVKIDKNNNTSYFNLQNGLSASLIMSIDENKKGQILIGTNEGGLNIIENNEIINIIDQNDGLASNVIFNTLNDDTGIVWIAVNGELAAYKNGELTHFRIENGLEDESPFDIIEDNSGNFWLPCSKGIMKIKKTELLDVINKKNTNFNCKLYNQNDGMYQPECNATTQSLISSDGSLLFPTIEGIAKITPSELTINRYEPPVIIESLIVDNELISKEPITTIDPGKKRFTFKYTALSLHEPNRNKFRYRLQGFDDEWVNAGNNRSISYTNLSPGNYVFQVIASNNDGIWNKKGDSFILNIKPKFIQTNSFYAILSVILFIIIYTFYLIRVRQLKIRHKILEKKVEIRTAELNKKNKELEEQKQETLAQAEKLIEQKAELEKVNTSKDKMFSIIAHDLRSPMGNFKAMLEKLTEFPENYDEKKKLRLLLQLSETAKNTFDLLENLLNWSKSQMGIVSFDPEIIFVAKLVSNIIKFIQPIADKKKICISSTIENSITVFADQNMVKTIFRNLIINAIKFTPDSGHINIFAVQKGNMIEFGIKDNGVGISQDIKTNLFHNPGIYSSLGTQNEKGSGLGLLLCKEFTELNGGEIRVESEQGIGSIFYFTLKTEQ